MKSIIPIELAEISSLQETATLMMISKLIGFLVVALVAVGLVFNASGVKDVLLQLFNKIIGA